MSHSAQQAIAALLVTLAASGAARAQVAPTVAALDSVSRAAIERIIDDARADGLPVTPLRNKIAEGVSKGANGSLIVRAVERLRDRMRRAATALGPNTGTADLVAAAAVLDIGITDNDLKRIRSARPDEPVANALVGLAFLVQGGARPDGAVDIVYDMLVGRVSDSGFDRFRETVARDVQTGIPIIGAARARANAAILRSTSGGFAPRRGGE
jgi:hypothetical protein